MKEYSQRKTNSIIFLIFGMVLCFFSMSLNANADIMTYQVLSVNQFIQGSADSTRQYIWEDAQGWQLDISYVSDSFYHTSNSATSLSDRVDAYNAFAWAQSSFYPNISYFDVNIYAESNSGMAGGGMETFDGIGSASSGADIIFTPTVLSHWEFYYSSMVSLGSLHGSLEDMTLGINLFNDKDCIRSEVKRIPYTIG